MFQSLSARRAWIEIKGETQEVLAVLTSLSARRAWIEMGVVAAQKQVHIVALRKESVDRNPIAAFLLMWWQRSLSARRAWIEI